MSINKIIAQINKKHGEGTISTADNFPKITRIPSGSLLLDLAIGGGIPVGRIGELFGAESSGKTWTALMISKEFTDRGIPTIFVDAEGSLDISLLDTFEIDKDLFTIIRTEAGEDYLDMVLNLAKAEEPSLIIIDSVPSLVPHKEIEDDFDKPLVSGNSRMMSKFMRLLVSTLNTQSKNKEKDFIGTTVILINQIRDNIGVMYGNPETTPGGNAIRHHSSWRARVRRSEWIHEGNNSTKDRIGQKITARFVKNKTFPPYREATYSIYFPPACSLVNTDEEVITAALSLKILTMKGSWVWYGDTRIAQGAANATEEIINDKKLFKEIKEKIYERMK